MKKCFYVNLIKKNYEDKKLITVNYMTKKKTIFLISKKFDKYIRIMKKTNILHYLYTFSFSINKK